MRSLYLPALFFTLLGSSVMAQQPQKQAMPGEKVQANGIKIYYEITGQGPHLILIEGLGVATWIWEKQLPDLARHFTTLVYDNRGTGWSDKPAGPYTISLLADDLAALMETLEIPRAHILGISMGGFIAQDFTLRFPEKVDKLVLVSTSAGGPDHVPMSMETLALLMISEGKPKALTRKRLTLAYSESFMQSSKVEHLIDLRLQNPQPRSAYLAQVSAGASFNLSDEVENIKAKTLIAAAANDLLVPVANARNLQAKLPNSELKIYPDLGHQFFVEIPGKFNTDVIEFLSNLN